jgi:hypothetical protein
MPTSDEEARLTKRLADIAAQNGLTLGDSRDYYPTAYNGATYKITIDLWQNAPQRKEIGTLVAWKKE